MDILKALEKIGAAVRSEIDSINSGGCCVFAAAAYPHINRLGLKPKIRVADPSPKVKALGEVRKYIDATDIYEWNNNGVRLGHVIIEFTHNGKKYFFDSKGVVERKGMEEPFCGFKLFRGALSFKEARSMASVERGWNARFNRNDIPKMHSILKENFARLEKSISTGKRFVATNSSTMKEIKQSIYDIMLKAVDAGMKPKDTVYI